MALLALLLPAGTSGQGPEDPVIHGRLVDAADGESIPAGEVHLLTAELSRVGTVLTDGRGEFRLVAPGRGSYRLRGERLGYRRSTSEVFHLVPGDTVTMEFRLRVEGVEVDPITVIASSLPWGSRVGLVGMDGFFERYARYGGTGFAEFLTRDSIAGFENRVPTAGHMLQWASRSVRSVDPETGEVTLRNGCAPSYYLNGTRVPYAMVEPLAPEMLQAVEVYVRPAIPAELASGAPCGVISYWSRQSPRAAGGSPVLRTVALLALGGGLVLLLVMTAF